MIDIHTHKEACDKAIVSLFHNSDIPRCGFFSIGVHPWKVEDYNNDDTELKKKIMHSRCLAIGECGLDKLKGVELYQQISVFEKHIIWSEQFKKPLIIHCVKAFNEIIKLKMERNPDQEWIIHGFNSKTSILKELLNHGFYISLGIDLLSSREKLKTYLDIIPDNRLFLETDDSGGNISDIYKFSAKFKGIDLVLLQSNIAGNFKKCFHIEFNGLAG
jgi:TatD DNase family protein